MLRLPALSMAEAAVLAEHVRAGQRSFQRPGAAEPELFGHPRGLAFLFTTEMWERFSYYGMRALLILYMTKYLLAPEHDGNVLGLASVKSALEAVFGPLDLQPLSSQIYGLYTALVYLTPIFGGLLADRVLGQRRTVILGAILMAIGHFLMAVEQLFLFALGALILGNGAFKPNISTQVGGLYAPGDPRRDRAFSIFYVGINVGAFLAPLVCGTLGEMLGWHYGFAAAGVGMLIGLAIYLYAIPLLPPDELQKAKAAARRAKAARPRRMARRRRVACAVPAQYAVLGDVRAAGQHDRIMGRCQHRPDGEFPRLDSRNTDDVVPGLQSLHDLRVHAVRGRVVEAAGGAGNRAIDLDQDGARLLRRHRGEPRHGAGGLARRRWQGELALAVRVFCRHHHRRALSLAGRAIARHQGRSRPHPFDDDGRLAGDKFCRQFPCRLYRELLEPDRQAGVFSDRRCDCRGCRRGDLRVSLAAAWHVAGMTPKLASRGSRRARRSAPSDVFRGAPAPAAEEFHGMSEVREWLRSHNLEQYADAFEANDIGMDILPELSERDLEQLGLSLGNRRRLLKAVAGRAAEAASPQQESPAQAAAEAERRQVTVLFCDMVGSTALSNAIDPELLGGVIRRYQDAVAGAIGRFGGFVAKFMGDGVLAYFGFPRAFEDAAERAVRAAINILAEVGGIELPDGSRARARIGIATGLVVVGEIVGSGTRAGAHHCRRHAQPRRAIADPRRARHDSHQ